MTDKNAMEMAEEARGGKSERISFARELFSGKFNPSIFFPYPEQDPEDKAVGDAYIEEMLTFLKGNLDPEEIEISREIPKKVIDGLVDLGAFALKVPKEYGGLGFSQTNYNRLIQHIASYCGSTAVLLSAHQSIGVPQPLKMYGTEEQKKKYFPRFRKGSISAFALTEPEVGSDPAKMTSTAELSEDGSHYILNGTKLWCTNGTIADVIVVMAKTAPKVIKGKERPQISSFILEMDSPGVEVLHRCEFMGLAGIYNGVLKFTDVKIPVENRLGEEGRGLAMALETINVGRLTLPAASVGVAKQCLSIARRWGRDRVQWGMPVGLHEAGREKLSYIAATTFAMEAVANLTGHWQDLGNFDLRIEGSMSKLFCTESLLKIADMTLQLRGGRGYEKASSLIRRGEVGYPVERIVRDIRINTILEGSTEIMKLFLAREAMDPHLERAGDLIKGKLKGMSLVQKVFELSGFYSYWYPSQAIKSFFSPSYQSYGKLAPHLKYAHKTSHKLALTLFSYMARYQKKLEYKQHILGRLMEIGTDLFVMSATCSYAVSKKDPYAIELADMFCKMAKRRIHDHFYSLSHNNDSEMNRIAAHVIDHNLSWLEEGIVWMGPRE